MKKSFFNFLWWFSTPYILTFFTLIILYENSINFDIIVYLKLNILLVLAPIIVYWSSAIFIHDNYHKREQISVWFLLVLALYSFFFDILKLDTWIIIILIIYFFSILCFLIFSYLKFNQYIQNIASFLILILSAMLFQNKDFYIWIIIVLLYSGIIMFLFIENNIDNSKNLFISYSVGILSSVIVLLISLFLEQKNVFEIIKTKFLR